MYFKCVALFGKIKSIKYLGKTSLLSSRSIKYFHQGVKTPCFHPWKKSVTVSSTWMESGWNQGLVGMD